MNEDATIWVRRQFNDHRLARYRVADLYNPHWDEISGGVYAVAPQPFIHAYAWCDAMIEGELAHRCRHGRGPHRIKVCITKNVNGDHLAAYEWLAEQAGPRPAKVWYQATITHKGTVIWSGKAASENSARRRARKALGLNALPRGCETELVLIEP